MHRWQRSERACQKHHERCENCVFSQPLCLTCLDHEHAGRLHAPVELAAAKLPGHLNPANPAKVYQNWPPSQSQKEHIANQEQRVYIAFIDSPFVPLANPVHKELHHVRRLCSAYR
jgi:hypothetical protein